jgi:hypothetical protein
VDVHEACTRAHMHMHDHYASMRPPPPHHTHTHTRTQTVTKMSMLDKGTAQVEWRLTGSVSGADVDIAHTSVLTLNLLTGRVESHRCVRMRLGLAVLVGGWVGGWVGRGGGRGRGCGSVGTPACGCRATTATRIVLALRTPTPLATPPATTHHLQHQTPPATTPATPPATPHRLQHRLQQHTNTNTKHRLQQHLQHRLQQHTPPTPHHLLHLPATPACSTIPPAKPPAKPPAAPPAKTPAKPPATHNTCNTCLQHLLQHQGGMGPVTAARCSILPGHCQPCRMERPPGQH